MIVSAVEGRSLPLAVLLASALALQGAEPLPPSVERPPGVPPLRLHGLVEPVNSHIVAAPRLAAGQPGASGQLVIVRLAASGAVVKKGDLLVEFDRHGQVRAASDREAEYRDFLAQLRKKAAEQRIAAARRETEATEAVNAVKVAELEMLGRELIPKIEGEKKEQALEEARAHLAALRTTQALDARVDAAELRMLGIQRDRALNAWRHAQGNVERMAVYSPIDGLVVRRSTWKGGTMAVVQEGDELRPGIPILDIVDPSAMRVRVLVNQADVQWLAVGQRARVALDAYPVRSFDARLDHLSPVATTSSLNPRVRTFHAVFSVAGTDPHLLPDLSAAVDVVPARPGEGGS